MAAFTAALLIGFEVVLTHWSYLYLPWFFPFVALTLIAAPPPAGDPAPEPRPEPERPWETQAWETQSWDTQDQAAQTEDDAGPAPASA